LQATATLSSSFFTVKYDEDFFAAIAFASPKSFWRLIAFLSDAFFSQDKKSPDLASCQIYKFRGYSLYASATFFHFGIHF
jgi:Sec-independent protein secretion pathway component TatC